MPSLRYSVLSLFESPGGHLAEISRTLRPAPETWVRQWIWIGPRHVMTLRPLTGQADGAFEECRLHLVEHGGEMRWATGRADALVRVDGGVLPPVARHFLELHLS